MSDFLRPEARAALFRWREALIGGAVIAFGLWLGLTRYGFVSWLGFGIAAIGAALVYTGLQHLRFRSSGDGPGYVEITERRVTYFGPLSGGMADLDLLSTLSFDPTGKPGHWRLIAETGAELAIPVNAAGAEALYDLFAALPGIRTEAMLSALSHPPATPVSLWEASRHRLR